MLSDPIPIDQERSRGIVRGLPAFGPLLLLLSASGFGFERASGGSAIGEGRRDQIVDEASIGVSV